MIRLREKSFICYVTLKIPFCFVLFTFSNFNISFEDRGKIICLFKLLENRNNSNISLALNTMATITCEIEREGVLSKVVSANHEVQFVPAKIKYSGPEKVQPYFSNFIKQNDNGSYTTALRGRPLTGSDIQL